jgi:probable rRNA maturation factor
VNEEMEKQIDMEITGDGDEPPEPTEPFITITVDEAVDGVNADWLETKTTSALELLGKNQSQLAVRVVNDATMIQLHQDHSNIAETTDVLTFDNGSSEASIHADIAICSDVASRALGDRNHALNEELLLYVVHGMLHCIGFDDHDEEAHLKMHEEEDRILTAIGVGPVWSSGS